MSIDRKLKFALLALVVSLPILGAALFTAYSHLTGLVYHRIDELERDAADLAERIETDVEALKIKAESVASFVGRGGDYTAVRQLADVAFLPVGENIIIHGLDGHQLFNSRFPLGSAPSPRQNSKFIQSVIATGKSVTSDVVTSPNNGELRAAVTVPIWQEASIIGTLSVSFGLDRFAKTIGHAGAFQGEQWAVTDRNGLVLARSNSIKADLGKPLTDKPRKAGEATEWVTDPVSGARIARSWMSTKASGWSVAVSVPESRLYVPVNNWLILYLVVLVVSVAIAVLLAGSLVPDDITYPAVNSRETEESCTLVRDVTPLRKA